MAKVVALCACIFLVASLAWASASGVRLRPLTKVGMWMLDTGLGDASVRDKDHYQSWIVDIASAVYVLENYAQHLEAVPETPPEHVSMRTAVMGRGASRVAADPDAPENPFDGYSGPAVVNDEVGSMSTSPNFDGTIATVGPSHNNVAIRGLTFSRGHGKPKPRIALLGGIHGDEIVGGEILLRFMRHLVSYGRANARLSALLDSIDLTIVPMINPDGFLAGTRNTSQNYDMNRSFYPDRCGTTAGIPPEPVHEVERLKTFLAQGAFDGVVFMHGGALVVSTPYDDECGSHGRGVAARGPEDKLYTAMGAVFARANAMIAGNGLFSKGVTNGARWYSISGSAQSWALVNTTAVLSLTFEVSSNKNPPFDEIQRSYWNANLPALLDFLEAVQSGVYLTVRYPDGAPVPGVRVNIAISRVTSFQMLAENPEREGKTVVTKADGTAFRMMPPGVWTVLITHPGNTGVVRTVVISDTSPKSEISIVLERVVVRPAN